MSELSELQQRVAVIGERFKATNDEERERTERLSQLIVSIEEGFARKKQQIESLREELARAQEDNRKLRAMLDSLLTAAENASVGGAEAVERELETRIGRLIETVSKIGAGGSWEAGESARLSATGGAGEVGAAGGPAVGPSREAGSGATPYLEPRSWTSGEASSGQGTPSEETSQAATSDGETPQGAAGEEGEPLELTKMVMKDGSVVDVNAEPESPREPERRSVYEVRQWLGGKGGGERKDQP